MKISNKQTIIDRMMEKMLNLGRQLYLSGRIELIDLLLSVCMNS